jgi:hypothetical protein
VLYCSPKNPKSAAAQWKGKLSINPAVLLTQQQGEPLWPPPTAGHQQQGHLEGPVGSSGAQAEDTSTTQQPPHQQQGQQGPAQVVATRGADIVPLLLSCLRQQGTPGPGYEVYVCGKEWGDDMANADRDTSCKLGLTALRPASCITFSELHFV